MVLSWLVLGPDITEAPCLWRLLVLGKNLNICGQGKASVVLVGLLAVNSQLGMDVKCGVVGAGVIFVRK